MAHSTREQLEILERRLRVVSAFLRGLPQWQIARDEDVDAGQISRDLTAIRKDWRAANIATYDAKIDQEVAKWNLLEMTYWEAWLRSCEDAETRTAKVVKAPDERAEDGTVIPGVARTESSKREEGQCGNSSFLQGVERCIEKRCKLLGLVVDKTAATTPDGQENCPPLEALVAAVIKVEEQERARLMGPGAPENLHGTDERH